MIVILIIIVLSTALFVIMRQEESKIEKIAVSEKETEKVGTKKIEKVTSRDDFYIVENCIKKYMKYIENQDVDKVYGCLDEEFISREEISREKITKQIENWETGDFIAKEMYVYDDTEIISEYFVKGKIENREYYIIVKIDYDNETFSVLPNYYIDESTIKNNNGIKIVEMKNKG